MKKQKKYNLLYLPAGKLIEIFGPQHPTPKGKASAAFEWHVVVKNRSDLKNILNRLLKGQFSTDFYRRNEIDLEALHESTLLQCHFIFQRTTIINTTESE